ncbi:hypothetical protein AGMMS50267_13290 [Spirochaetia bacterium]|nr:hypothetical protein AGMMS50267_13290 [Spirochaetia bacterium]
MKKLVFVGIFLAGCAGIFAADFTVELNQADGIYHPGNPLEITLFSDTPCYFQITLTDAENNTQILYPDPALPNDNAALPANTRRTVPGASEEPMTLVEPFGTETLTVTFSKKPVTGAGVARADVLATKKLSYRIVPYILVREFESPAAVLQAVKNDIIAAGGKVSGDAQKGTFQTPVMTIRYEITGKQLAFIMPKDPALFNVALTRGAVQPPLKVALTIPPAEIPGKFDDVRQKFASQGGDFRGDTSKGNFNITKPIAIQGSYEVDAANVDITIPKYPSLFKSAIESGIKEYFK